MQNTCFYVDTKTKRETVYKNRLSSWIFILHPVCVTVSVKTQHTTSSDEMREKYEVYSQQGQLIEKVVYSPLHFLDWYIVQNRCIYIYRCGDEHSGLVSVMLKPNLQGDE